MSKKEYPISVPALRAQQPLGEFYVVILPASVLLEITYSDPLRFLGSSPHGDYDLRGHQRQLGTDRLKDIGRYIDTVEAAFPNTIILAANYLESGELVDNDEERWHIDSSKGNANPRLIIPGSKKITAIVDGQHRLYGFNYAKKREHLDMPLVCSVFLDLPNPFQAYLFATINYNQKPVDKSQSYELYGYNLELEDANAWSPEKLAVFLCRKLNTEDGSPFKGHIIIAAQIDAELEFAALERKTTWAVSTATIVEGLLRLYSSNPRRDRDLMHRKAIDKGRERSLLVDTKDGSPLRDFYLSENDLLIYTVTKNYFSAVSELLWNENRRSYIQKTVGIQALFDILRKICRKAVESKKISKKYFSDKLADLHLIDFSSDFFQASGTGRQRIRNTIELSLGLADINDMRIDERPAYAKLCHLK
jgi:DNA phosphorothioation-associated DGQHR protein 1